MADLEQLAPAPRPLPRALAARVWLTGFVVFGAVALGLSSIGLVYAVRRAELPGEWRPFWGRREAPGWLTNVTTQNNHDRKRGHTISHTYRYTLYALWQARSESRLLRLGEPSAGHVNRCRLPPRKSTGTAGVGDASVSWSSTSREAFQSVCRSSQAPRDRRSATHAR
jgi:hypothetical protein